MESRHPTPLLRFLRWWVAELKALLPGRDSQLRGAHPRRLVVAVEEGRSRLLLEKAGRSETLAEAAEHGDAGLIELAPFVTARPELPVGVRFGPQDCYGRTLELPARAEADFGRILDLDMERTTPFRSGDVLTAYCAVPGAPASPGKRAVRHLIIKRRTIDPLLERLRELGIEPAFADCWSEDRSGGLPVNFLAAAQRRQARSGPGLAVTLAGSCAVLAVAAVAVPIARCQHALDALNAQVAIASSDAASVRLAVDASQTASAQVEAMARLRRDRLPLARVLEELTAILPDSSWVSDLRIDGDAVEFTGFAKSAASLVPLLENSPLFMQAGLTSSVVLDSGEDKEHFSIRLRLSIGSPSPGASAGIEPATQPGDGL